MPKSCALSSLSIYLLISFSFRVNSLSHTILTITVNIFEVAVDGEEFVKTGRLKLVDLGAGKSNEEAKRTFERVMTAVSEKAPFVPYRYVEQGCPIASALLVNVV